MLVPVGTGGEEMRAMVRELRSVRADLVYEALVGLAVVLSVAGAVIPYT